ncbi:restriction endonuclease subunit S [Pseudoalteromonas sp. SR45-4]|uniref:restriction endonuclease subunit S n=1 Tax=Pseudoalteromonas sp. SR45-4 TaxID=2760929 RepID=UPI0015FAB9E9|nr:restriction endonuclease subunit S [Pseudoalteromonas sp. SR45-4]MBB1369429.1 restriction endonuclease subunit S [Pseudoalteromonas sp. SR45-4]
MMQVLRFSEFETHIENGKIGDLVETLNSGVSVNSYDYPIENDESTGILKTSSIANGFFFVDENKKVIEGDLQRVKNSLRKDTILVSRMNTPALVGEVGYIDKNYDNLFVPDRLWVLKANYKCFPKWLTYMLIAPRTKSAIKNRATGTSASMKNISKPSFLNIKIPIPYYEEQQKIANFLSSVDKKISLLKEKHALLTQYKKGMIQKLFKQEIRFKDENGNAFPDWELKPLSKLADKNSLKNKDNAVNAVLTNSAKSGIVNQGDYFNKDIANQGNLTGYTVVEKNDFIYNPRISVLAPVGPIKRNHIGQGVMSPLYTAFRFKDESVLDYLEQYFNTTMWHRYMHSIANFGARHDRMNITSADFYALPIPLPCEDEREKIVSFIKALETKVNAVKEQIELTETFKKGLLQQMFV